MSFSTTHLNTQDGANLAVYQWPGTDPGPTTKWKGVVQLSHGMSEHARRYEPLATKLVSAGYVVYAHDHRGHGQSVRSGDELGFFAEDEGWAKVVADVDLVRQHAAARHPGVPHVLLGHSMGSFIAQDYLFTYSDSPPALAVLSATNTGASTAAKAGLVLAYAERLRLGPRGRSKLLEALGTGKYNRAFRPNRTDADWLSRDQAEVDKYIADPLCGFAFTVQGWIDLLNGLVRIDDAYNQSRVSTRMPIYLFSGDEDQVGRSGVGVIELAAAYRRLGNEQVTYRLYPGGRHEMLNETNRSEVETDLLTWLNAHIPAAT